MTTTEFKTGLRNISNNLQGLTLQLVNSSSVTPFNNLREFGLAILCEEAKGNSFSVSQVWTSNGIIPITSFTHLIEVMSSTKVTAIQFKAYRESVDFTDYLKNSFGTTN